MASEFYVQVGDRQWDVEFTVDRFKASERALGRPLVSTMRDERGWRGFTLEEIEELLWVQVREQTKRLTKEQFIATLERDLTEKRRTIREWHEAILGAFNKSELIYRQPVPEAEKDATGDAALHPLLVVVPAPAAQPMPLPTAAAVGGTSGSPVD